MKTLPVVTEPNKILHQRGQDLAIIDDSTKQFARVMFETMVKERGVGIAAPQVGKSLRMFVVAFRDGYKTFINPEIYWRSKRTDVDEEGCLSIPGFRADIRRPIAVKIRFRDETGESFDMKASGFFARVIQHEYDHIEGILITDRAKEK